LPFPLLLDPDRKIATEYGAANGIPILGLDRRMTYVINEDGYIEKIYPNVRPETHANQILAEVKPVPTPTPTPTVEATPSPTPKPTPEPDEDSGDSGDDYMN
jgi:alkyl hydroperoxide reductase subunit AhpC